jgi:hypothetical protein
VNACARSLDVARRKIGDRKLWNHDDSSAGEFDDEDIERQIRFHFPGFDGDIGIQ